MRWLEITHGKDSTEIPHLLNLDNVVSITMDRQYCQLLVESVGERDYQFNFSTIEDLEAAYHLLSRRLNVPLNSQTEDFYHRMEVT